MDIFNTRLKRNRRTVARIISNLLAGLWVMVGMLALTLWPIPLAIIGHWSITSLLSIWVDKGADGFDDGSGGL